MTELFLDKEDDMLDYCKKVVFTSNGSQQPSRAASFAHDLSIIQNLEKQP